MAGSFVQVLQLKVVHQLLVQHRVVQQFHRG